MKRIFKYLLYALSVILLLALALVGWIMVTKPNVSPPQEMSIERTPERIERGEYLANHVMLCMDCHAQRDYSLFAGPIAPGTEGSGGEVFDQKMGFPGRFISPNITPSGVGDWTDGELFRAITTGVTKDGQALFPVMPWPNFAKMDPEDIKAVIAYIRTLEPIDVVREKSQADFPVNIIMRTFPQEATFSDRPDPSDKIAYGEYLVTAASCGDCHTKMEKGEFTGTYLAGGQAFPLPGGIVATSHNLTPHESGIGKWSREMFIDAFKQFRDSSYQHKAVNPGDEQTIMPWIQYGGMTDSDLSAIYDYLQSLEPVENEVVKYTHTDNKVTPQ